MQLIICFNDNRPIKPNNVTKNTNTATAITERPETANATKLAIKVPIAPKVKHFKYLQKHLRPSNLSFPTAIAKATAIKSKPAPTPNVIKNNAGSITAIVPVPINTANIIPTMAPIIAFTEQPLHMCIPPFLLASFCLTIFYARGIILLIF